MAQLGLETRQSAQISNDHTNGAITPGQVAEANSLAAKFSSAKRRKTQPSLGYNCHGLTFASRRTWIDSSDDVRRILTEDGYTQIPLVDVEAGDIAIYIEEGSIEHSGIVVDVPDGLLRIPRVLSKWGTAHEYLHPFNHGPYPTNVEFYRLVK